MTLEDAQDILIGEDEHTDDEWRRAENIQYRAFEALANIKSLIKYPIEPEELINHIAKEIKFVESWGDE